MRDHDLETSEQADKTGLSVRKHTKISSRSSGGREHDGEEETCNISAKIFGARVVDVSIMQRVSSATMSITSESANSVGAF